MSHSGPGDLHSLLPYSNAHDTHYTVLCSRTHARILTECFFFLLRGQYRAGTLKSVQNE